MGIGHIIECANCISEKITQDIFTDKVNIKKGIGNAIANRQVTYDLARLMEPKVDPPLKCSEFAQAIIDHFKD
ncbi:hypothetical protein [Cyanothece sp. BG0011]|uniref:hypothetical protein n=1 Tax=Cyanothece sp. BG0011 TaxID=2082950 RepID=UPI000D1E217A|nr:hypothetical protein [Cyanothece sp. BG0011]